MDEYPEEGLGYEPLFILEIVYKIEKGIMDPIF
jgi:hypothetical protein